MSRSRSRVRNGFMKLTRGKRKEKHVKYDQEEQEEWQEGFYGKFSS